jgi:hypothetical protein
LPKQKPQRTVLCKHIDGKALFTGILRLYAAIHREMNETLQSEQVESPMEFREQKRPKRNASDKQGSLTSNTVVTGCGVRDSRIRPQAGLPTRNFFAPLRTEMELEGTKEETNDGERPGTTNQAGRPPPIILTSATNLLQLQKSIKGIVKGSFEFRNTKNGTRALTKEMAHFSAIKSFLSKKFSFYTFFPKSQKPIKAVIRHLPSNTPAEEICEALVELRFDTISVRQMTTTRRSPLQNPEHSNLPLYLITLPRTEKSQDIFKLTGLCHISIKVPAYRNQNGLTQCYNC